MYPMDLPNGVNLRLRLCLDAVTGVLSLQNIKKFVHETSCMPLFSLYDAFLIAMHSELGDKVKVLALHDSQLRQNLVGN